LSVKVHTEANPTHATISIDVANAFNEAKRAKILQALWEHPTLRPLWYYCYSTLLPISYVGVGSGTYLRNAPFFSAKGTQQGAIEASPLFCLVLHATLLKTHNRLSSQGGGLTAGMDDEYFVGQPHQDSLREIGLTLRSDKTNIYIPESQRTPQLLNLCQEHGIQEGDTSLSPGHTARGLKIYGVSFGEPAYVKAQC
jgi:hypothetical protein